MDSVNEASKPASNSSQPVAKKDLKKSEQQTSKIAKKVFFGEQADHRALYKEKGTHIKVPVREPKEKQEHPDPEEVKLRARIDAAKKEIATFKEFEKDEPLEHHEKYRMEALEAELPNLEKKLANIHSAPVISSAGMQVAQTGYSEFTHPSADQLASAQQSYVKMEQFPKERLALLDTRYKAAIAIFHKQQIQNPTNQMITDKMLSMTDKSENFSETQFYELYHSIFNPNLGESPHPADSKEHLKFLKDQLPEGMTEEKMKNALSVYLGIMFEPNSRQASYSELGKQEIEQYLKKYRK